ncbi:LytR family transcriptional regulator, partial [Blastococcus sp. CT_GayMR16]
MGEQPTRDGAGGRDVSRGVPGRTRRDARTAAPEAVTVEQLLARQGGVVSRRRAARRVEEPAPRIADDPQPAVRAAGLPPVPGAVRQAGLPP